MNQYFFEKTLSIGSGSQLNLCYMNKGGGLVVVKELTDSNNISNFEAELEVLNIVGYHPNIIRLRDSFFFRDNAFLVYDYYPSGDLFNFVKRNGPLKEYQAITVLKKTALALKYARRHGFFHCDVKPENILIHNDNDFVLADWDLARHSDQRKSSMHYGSKLVMAPEVILGQIYDNSDVYSLGCLMHYCLTGQRAYGLSSASPIHEKVIAHLKKDYSLPAEFHSRDLGIFVRSMMNKNPRMRPSIQDVIDFVEGDDKWVNESFFREKCDIYNNVSDVIDDGFRDACAVKSRKRIFENTPFIGSEEKESLVIAHRLVLAYLGDEESYDYIKQY